MAVIAYCASSRSNPAITFDTGPKIYLDHVVLRAAVFVLAKSNDFIMKTTKTMEDIFKKVMQDYAHFHELGTALGEEDLSQLIKLLVTAASRGEFCSPDRCGMGHEGRCFL